MSAPRACAPRSCAPMATSPPLHYRAFPPSSPFPGLVEFDAAAMAAAVLEVAHAALAEAGPVQAVGITAQRASTVVWDRATGEPVGPGLGWQDLRTVFDCITAKAEHGLRARTQPVGHQGALAAEQPRRRAATATCASARSTPGWRGCFATARVHVTDHSNAALTGLMLRRRHRLVDRTRRAMSVPTRHAAPPGRHLAACSARPRPCPVRRPSPRWSATSRQPRRPELRAARPGQDHVRHRRHARPVHRPRRARARGNRTADGTFPIVAWSRDGAAHLGRRGHHAVGRHQRRVAGRATWASSPRRPRATTWPRSATTTGGVVYVPALMGLGTPHWDYGARGTLLGLTRGTGRPAGGARRARGRGPSRRRPGGGRRGRRRRHRSPRCASTAA